MSRIRSATLVALALAALAGCSSADGGTVGRATSIATTVPSDLRDRAEDAAVATTTASPEPRLVRLAVESSGLGIDAVVSAAADRAGNLFGTVALCSAFDGVVAAYTVGVGADGGPIRWVSVATADTVDGAGVYDADIRVERRVGGPIDATGTVTLSADLSSGSFVAFDVAGEPLRGEFACTGGGSPTPIADAGTGVVEVVALVRRVGVERIVSVAGAAHDEVSCTGGLGDRSSIVEVNADGADDAIPAFELVDDGDAGVTMRLQVGRTVFESSGVDLLTDDPTAAGTFSAGPSDGTTVDGAYSCS